MTYPFVLRNQLKSWPLAGKAPTDLIGILGDQLLKMRVGQKLHSPGTILWETDCQYVTATMKDFVDWNEMKTMATNPLAKFSPKDFWCYIDYKEMFCLFEDSVLEAVDWSQYGIEDRNGLDSTFWCGSSGAYTPCHFDTYGFNLVAQTYGKKRWVMFPPSDTDMMRPSRIPYEESSVFSQLDILSVPNELEKTCPHVVTLEAGDLLFVPSKWWHFVQCQDISITINSWVPIPNDSEVQLDEAIVRATVHLFTGEDAKKQRINPTEEMELDTDELLGTVEHLISQHSTGPPGKKQRLDDPEISFFNRYCKSGVRVPQVSFEHLKDLMRTSTMVNEIGEASAKESVRLSSDDFLNFLTHSETVAVMKRLIYDKLSEKT